MLSPPDFTRAGLRCCIVADDLTGSCDAAVHFADRGMSVRVMIAGGAGGLCGAQVIGVNTGSRAMGLAEAVGRVREAFREVGGSGAVLLKKIDSSLRGHLSAELDAAMEASGCGLAFVAPALPALGRTMAAGRVVLPSGEAISLMDALAPLRCRLVPTDELLRPDAAREVPARALREGMRILCFDADNDAHLDRIVELGLGAGQRVLWVGSAGLAAALARAMGPSGTEQGGGMPEGEGPVLFGVGTNHRVTLGQVAKLRETGVLECSLDTACTDALRDAVRDGRDVLLHLPPCGMDAEKIRAFARAAPLSSFGGMVLTGGDTALRFLDAMGAHTLEVRAERMPGIPVSLVRGGIAEGMRVVTKSGAFGAEDALVRCAELFAGSGKVVAEGKGL